MCGTAFPGLGDGEALVLIPYLLAQCFWVDEHTGEPIVGLGVCGTVGVHGDWKVFEAFFVPLIDGFFLGDVFIQMGVLSPDYSGNDIAHAVVVAQFFVLVPGCIFPGLGGPFAHFVCCGQVFGEEHAAGGASDDFIAIEADDIVIAETSGGFAFIGGAQRFCGIFDKDGVVFVTDGFDVVDFCRDTVEMGNDDNFDFWINLESLFQGDGVHVPGVVLGINKDGLSPFIDDGVDGGGEGHVGAEDLVSRLDASQFNGQMDGGGAGGKGDGVLMVEIFSNGLFNGVEVLTHGGHPVGVIGFFDILHFFSMHSGGR